MNPLEIMKHQAAYASGYENTPIEAQNHAKWRDKGQTGKLFKKL